MVVDRSEPYIGRWSEYWLEDGLLRNESTPGKYASVQYKGGYAARCAGKDELYYEAGYADFDESGLIHVREKRVSVAEAIDLEDDFATWAAMTGETRSMDAFFAENERQYGFAE